MRLNALDYLACPECQGALRHEGAAPSLAEIDEGSLDCAGCGVKFPIKNGIPRFVSTESYAGSFGYEWRELFPWRTEDNLDSKEEEAIFRVKTGWQPEDVAGRLTLDAGCGSGRYAFVASSWGAPVVAVDISSAVERARQICRGRGVTVIQADLLKLPFKSGVFSRAYSIGVLHHTPDTRAAFHSVSRTLGPDASLAVWLYRKNSVFQELLNGILRSLTLKMSRENLVRFSKSLAVLAGVPVLNAALGRIINLGCTHPEFGKRVTDAFDWYSPVYQWHHTDAEIEDWFKQEGFNRLKRLPPQKSGALYDWFYHNNLIIGSGVNWAGWR